MSFIGNLLSLPFRLLWGIVRLIVGLTGRLLAVVIGVVLVVAGVVLTLTVIGAIVGVARYARARISRRARPGDRDADLDEDDARRRGRHVPDVVERRRLVNFVDS